MKFGRKGHLQIGTLERSFIVDETHSDAMLNATTLAETEELTDIKFESITSDKDTLPVCINHNFIQAFQYRLMQLHIFLTLLF